MSKFFPILPQNLPRPADSGAARVSMATVAMCVHDVGMHLPLKHCFLKASYICIMCVWLEMLLHTFIRVQLRNILLLWKTSAT